MSLTLADVLRTTWLAVVFAFISAQCTCAVISPNIVGGQDANEREFPYIVSLRYYGGHICGASILDARHILTAAHCVVDISDQEELSIQYGTNEISEYSSNTIDVLKIAVHKGFDPDVSYANDIAVLTLKRGIPLSKVASVVALPRQGQATPANAGAVLAGWGDLEPSEDEDSPSPEYLQKIALRIYSDKKCVSLYSSDSVDPQYQICAGITDNDTGACTGDSGGPLTVNGVQFGIVSFGTQPCADGMPTVFTKVSNYVDWIRNQMR